MPLKSNEILNIIEQKDGQQAVMDIWDVLHKVYMESPYKLTQQEFNFYLIETFIMEVHSGGFDSFFGNSYGDLTKETLIALKEVKSSTFKSIFERAMAQFPNSIVPKDINERLEIIDQIIDTADEAWDMLDNECYKYEEDIDGLLIKYIKSNIEHFR